MTLVRPPVTATWIAAGPTYGAPSAGMVQVIVVAVGTGVVSGQLTLPAAVITVTTSLAPVVEKPVPEMVSLLPPLDGPLVGPP